jgi:F420-dependent methylenetetrahydromethanopterin dehydrogenase
MAIYRASEFFRTHDEGVLLSEMKTYSLTGRLDLLQEAIDRFREQADIAMEVEHVPHIVNAICFHN